MQFVTNSFPIFFIFRTGSLATDLKGGGGLNKKYKYFLNDYLTSVKNEK
jgi:hypothetical protein